MKTILCTSALTLAVMLLAIGCKKDETTQATPSAQTACNGKNLCMKIDGKTLEQDAKWKTINSGRTRILWEEGSGTTYKNIELDIYGTAKGTYTVSANPTSGQAGFQYYENTGMNLEGQSGTVEVTSTDNNTYTGTFTITTKDQNGNTVEITEGNFVKVPQ